MNYEEKIAKRYAQDELKDNHGQVEDIVAAAFLNGIDYAENHPRWISVEDELPERDEDVLILTPQNLVHIAAYKYRNWQTKVHVFASGIDGYSWNNVTHWMPLPAPPKKGGRQ